MKALQIIGGLAIGQYLLGNAANAISRNISYSILPMRIGDFSIKVVDGVVLGILRLRLQVKNETGVNLTAQSFSAIVSQQGVKLGDVLTANRVELVHGEEKELGVNVNIGATTFLSQIQKYFSGEMSFVAPLDIRGKLTFTNGQSIIINRQLQFFALQ